MHNNSKLLFEHHALPLLKKGMTVLEIGPDSFPSTYQILAKDLYLEWHTLDIYDSPHLTYSNSNEYSFTIPDESYDFVVSGQVIEHVRKPWKWMPELARITKIGGLIITINPVSWFYHEAPIDCWRIYPEGMKALCEESSLEVIISRWESLETPYFRKFIPGISKEFQHPQKQLLTKIFGRFGLPGLPVERSYDTITIAKKVL